MIGKYDENPLIELHNSLLTNIYNFLYNNIDDYTPIDSVAKAILANNGCGFSNTSYGKTEFIVNNSYGLYFIIGGVGNKVNDWFDFMEIKGMDYIVIFLDKFKDFLAKPDGKDEIALNAAIFMGKSIYFDMICKITEIFIAITTNPAVFTNQLSTSTSARNYRFAPSIIASNIIYQICGELNENDVSGVDYEFIKDIVENDKISLALYGIHKFE